MTIIDGKATAASIKQEIAAEVENIVNNGGRRPHLGIVIVGHDGGSEAYVGNAVKNCEVCGFDSTVFRNEENITEEEFMNLIERLNNDPAIDGYIVQMPLPRHIDSDRVAASIAIDKDVDGCNPANIGRMLIGLPSFKPATPSAVMELLKRYNVETRGKHAVVLGRSNIVGKPAAIMLMEKATPGNCTVTVCHSATKDLKEKCREADIIVAALGQPGFVTADMVKPGAVVMDVGTTRVPDPTRKSGSRLAGDVAFDEVAEIASMITPVPGGVGPMTICSLMLNTLEAYRRNTAK